MRPVRKLQVRVYAALLGRMLAIGGLLRRQEELMSARFWFCVVCSASLALTGCAVSWRPLRGADIGTVSANAMTADYRLVTLQQNPKDATAGKHMPVLCAEPSPDIARAFSNAF